MSSQTSGQDVLGSSAASPFEVELVHAGMSFSSGREPTWGERSACAREAGKASVFRVDTQSLALADVVCCGRVGGDRPEHPCSCHYHSDTAEERPRRVRRTAIMDSPAMRRSPHETGEPERRRACLLESFFSIAHRFLHHDCPDEQSQRMAKDYLAACGFDPGRLEVLPVGLFVDHRAIEQGLRYAGFAEEEVERSRLTADRRLTGRLVGPIRDVTGRIAGFWARCPRRDDARTLYLASEGRQDVAAFGLDVALRASQGSAHELVLVEDLMDALLLQSKGMMNVAAMVSSQNELTRRRWERLASLGVERATLVVGRDESSRRRVLTALENAFRASIAPVLYVLPAGGLGAADTPGEFVRRKGVRLFRSLLAKRRVHSYCYKAHEILRRHGSDCRWTATAKRAVLEEAIQFYVSLNRQTVRDLDVHFVPPIVDALGLGWRASEPGRKFRWQTSFAPPQEVVEAAPAGATRVVVRATPEPPRSRPFNRPPTVPAPVNPGACEFHRCDPLNCFCFD